MAPEVLSMKDYQVQHLDDQDFEEKLQGAQAGYDCRIDVWSVGVLAQFMVTGVNIFGLQDDLHLGQIEAELEWINEHKQASNHHVVDMTDDVWPTFIDFVLSCLVYDIDKRSTIFDVIQHPWFLNRHKCNTGLFNDCKIKITESLDYDTDLESVGSFNF